MFSATDDGVQTRDSQTFTASLLATTINKPPPSSSGGSAAFRSLVKRLQPGEQRVDSYGSGSGDAAWLGAPWQVPAPKPLNGEAIWWFGVYCVQVFC